MIKIIALKKDSIDEISRLTGLSTKTLQMKLAKSKREGRLSVFTINSDDWSKV